jgi:hypothetical protein
MAEIESDDKEEIFQELVKDLAKHTYHLKLHLVEADFYRNHEQADIFTESVK